MTDKRRKHQLTKEATRNSATPGQKWSGYAFAPRTSMKIPLGKGGRQPRLPGGLSLYRENRPVRNRDNPLTPFKGGIGDIFTRGGAPK